MTPQDAINALDGALVEAGEDVVLRRVTGTTGAVHADVTIRAGVRDYKPSEIVAGSGLVQGDSLVRFTLTQINAVGWPGTAGGPPDPRIPTIKDKVFIGGAQRSVISAAPIRMNGEIVRINMQVRG